MAWTTMQQAAISERGANILVSAAAGSGKTAVLTERVFCRIMGTDGEEPIELDHFLIVTFTSAAAQEMKERITSKLSAVMNELVDDTEENIKQLEYLERQMALVPQASISTIHAFCLKTIKAYFNRLDMDPNIKVGNDAELKMMQEEILEELMETYLDEGNPDFLELAEVYGTAQGLDGLKKILLEIDTFSKSTPFPKQWLKEHVAELKVPYTSINEMPWAATFKRQILQTIEDLSQIYAKAKALCQAANGPEFYLEALESDWNDLSQINEEQTLVEMIETLRLVNFVALSRKKQECDARLKEQVKAYRDLAKEIIKELQEDLAYVRDEKLLKQLPYVGHLMESMVQVIEDFEARYTEAKKEAGVVDYNDLEHLCLELLIEPVLDEEGYIESFSYTDVAKELSAFYKEVYIDEYQDSNMVQETLLGAVALAGGEKGPKRFMVGDMKQSIYRFRLANPLIFAEKYQEWEKHQGSGMRTGENVCIDLSQNFRSRENILEGVNDLFDQVMSEAVGDLAYDDYARLRVGNHYEAGHPEALPEGALSDAIELHILETKSKETSEKSESEAAELKDAEYEALMTAELIHQLLSGKGNPTHVYDKEQGEYRLIEPRDIVILLRAPSGKAEIYENALMRKGIGAYAEVNGNFFEALEIQTLLSLLQIIDNPLQDIPLLTVLRSPIVGITLDECVDIRQSLEDGYLYDALKIYAESLKEEAPIRVFLRNLEAYRDRSCELKVEELLSKLYVETGYYRYVAMLPVGAKKKANLDLLKKYAAEYENNHHGKLFGFLQYMQKLSQTPDGLKEAKLVGDNENMVRIMSIHKSKGLEFSVVFLCDTGKTFNQNDLRNEVLLHNTLGMAPDYTDIEGYVKYPTLPKLALKQQIKSENISEEMRVLYVALTRAKEKLFITGTLSDVESQVKKWQMFASRKEKAIIPLGIKRGGTYLNWIGLSLYAHSQVDFFRNQVQDTSAYLFEGRSKWHVQVWQKEDLVQVTQSYEQSIEDKKVELMAWDTNKVYSPYKEEIERRLSFEYAYQDVVSLPTKLSVSEIKKNAYTPQDEIEGVSLFTAPMEAPVPQFIKTQEKLEGAKRGTLIHSVLEHLDYLNYTTEEAIATELERLVFAKKLEPEVLAVVNPKDLAKMSQSPIMMKMRQAKQVQKEKAFMYLADAYLVDPTYPKDEKILIQGVIDAYFIDEEGITLVDYKTDYIDLQNKEASIQKIKKRYALQLALYAKALEDITKISVAHQCIYLYNINEWIHL